MFRTILCVYSSTFPVIVAKSDAISISKIMRIFCITFFLKGFAVHLVSSIRVMDPDLVGSV
jgi:hypothetical protein